MPKINTPPLGFQDVLGSKNFGANPDNFLQDVRPSLEMLPFYAVQKLQVERTTGSATTVSSPNQVAITIPAGEVWLVQSINASVNVGAAVECAPICSLRALPGQVAGTAHPLAAGIIQPLLGGESYPINYTPPQPLLLESDTEITAGWWHSDNGAETKFIFLTVLFSRLLA